MNDHFTRRIFDGPMFRRYSGLMGRDLTAPEGKRTKAGQVAPWNWLKYNDVPPATYDGAPTLEE
eukprot:11562199-Alexandrium_andersonii.AAC.1